MKIKRTYDFIAAAGIYSYIKPTMFSLKNLSLSVCIKYIYIFFVVLLLYAHNNLPNKDAHG